MRTIYMMGDSTMQFNKYKTYPQTGWGQVLNLFTQEDVNVVDLAVNGRSTKSYIDEGRFNDLLGKVKEGDYVICQFGHNDEKKADPLRYTTPEGTYIENLKFFNDSVVKKGAKFILATSITRRNFINGVCEDSHKGYPQAMLKFAAENNIDCVDLNTLTLNLYNKLGAEETKKFHMIFPAGVFPNYPDGKEDNSHLRYEGAHMVCELFVNEVFKKGYDIKNFLYDPNGEFEIDWSKLID